MRSRIRHSRHKEVTELNVTAFMNLMVVLVPFLLVMAVFSRMTILELSLPTSDNGANQPQPAHLDLEVIVRKDSVDIGARGQGVINHIPDTDKGHDLAAVSKALQKFKDKFPDKTDATVLLEPQIPYQQVVSVMDTVRMARVEDNGEARKRELFPDISIGDAPVKTK